MSYTSVCITTDDHFVLVGACGHFCVEMLAVDSWTVYKCAEANDVDALCCQCAPHPNLSRCAIHSPRAQERKNK